MSVNNNVYRWTWTDINTNDVFKVEMLAPSSTALTSPTVVAMPDDSLLDISGKWDFSNKDWGMQQTDITMRLRLNRLTFETANLLTRPFVDYSLSFTVPAMPTVFNVDIALTLSNVFNLFRNGVFVCSFIQKNGITSGYKSKTTEFEITLVPVFRAALESMKFSYFEDLWRSDDAYLVQEKAIYSICKRIGGNNVVVGVTTTSANNHNDYFWFISKYLVDYYATQMVNKIMSVMLRTALISYVPYETLLKLPYFYKQRIDGDEAAEIIADEDLLLLGWVASKPIASKTTAAKYDSLFAFMGEKWSNFYNFLKDHADFLGYRVFCDGTLYPHFVPTTSDELAPDDLHEGLEIFLSSDVVKNANASLHLSYNDDIDNVRLETKASYAQESRTMPVTFNNIPNALPYTSGRGSNGMNEKKFGISGNGDKVWHRGFDINWLGVYYFERPYSAVVGDFITTDEVILLADNYVVCDIGEGVLTSNAGLSPISYYDVKLPTGNLITYEQYPDQAKDTCIGMQAVGCVTNAMLNAIIALYGKDSLTRAEGTVFNNVHDGGSPWFWLLPKREVQINLADYDAKILSSGVNALLFFGLSNKFNIVEADFSFGGYDVGSSTTNFKAVSRELAY